MNGYKLTVCNEITPGIPTRRVLGCAADTKPVFWVPDFGYTKTQVGIVWQNTHNGEWSGTGIGNLNGVGVVEHGRLADVLEAMRQQGWLRPRYSITLDREPGQWIRVTKPGHGRWKRRVMWSESITPEGPSWQHRNLAAKSDSEAYEIIHRLQRAAGLEGGWQ